MALRLRNGDDARDGLQETLTAAWQAFPRLRRADRYWPWLVGIASRKASDIVRRRARFEERAISEELLPGRSQESDIDFRAALASLPEPFREILLLRYLLGLSERETAAILGVAIGTVKSRCARGREELAGALNIKHEVRGRRLEDGSDGTR